MKRAIFDILLFLSVFTMPWWISFILAFVGIFAFKQFYEFIIVWIILYSIFAIPNTRFISSPLWFSLIVGMAYVSIQYVRQYMIIYKNEI